LREEVKRVIANWMNPQYMRLYAGEMTGLEVRSVRAIVECVGREIDALLTGSDAPPALDDFKREAFRIGQMFDDIMQNKEHPCPDDQLRRISEAIKKLNSSDQQPRL